MLLIRWKTSNSSSIPTMRNNRGASESKVNRTYSELHALGTGSSEFSRHNNLATLRTALHDKSKNTIACSSNSKAVKKLVS